MDQDIVRGRTPTKPRCRDLNRKQTDAGNQGRLPLERALCEITSIMDAIAHHQRSLELVCKACVQLLDLSYAAVWQVQGSELVRKAAWSRGRNKPERLDVRQPLKGSLLGGSEGEAEDHGNGNDNGVWQIPLASEDSAVIRQADGSLTLTLQWGDGATALLTMGWEQERQMDPGETTLARALASCASTALEMAHADQRAKEMTRELVATGQVLGMIATSSGIRPWYRRFTSVMKRLVGFDRASLFLPSDPAGSLHHRRSAAPDVAETGSWHLGQARKDPDPSVPATRAGVAADAGTGRLDEPRGAGVGSTVQVPVAQNKQVVGVLSVSSKRPGTYGSDQKRCMERLARNIPLALEWFRMRRELDSHGRRLRLLRKTREAIQHSRSLERSLESVVQAATRLGPASYAGIFLSGPNSHELILAAEHTSLGPGEVGLTGSQVNQTLMRRCLEEAAPQIVETGPNTNGAAQPSADYPNQSGAFLGLPLLVVNDELGVLAAERIDGPPWSTTDVELMSCLAAEAALAIHAARISRGADREAALHGLDQVRSRIVATIAHELRTPLASIKGYLSTLLQSDVAWDEERRRRFLSTADQAADRLDSLLTDLLTMSQAEAGVLGIDQQWHDLPDVLGELAEQLESITPDHVLRIHVDGSLPLVYCDKSRVAQVLMNLVSNASKFSPEGSEVSVRAAIVDEGVAISVTDHGIGIPPDETSRVFDRFYRLGASSGQYQRGTGLGLSICRELVEAHGGRIWAESTLGSGSTFFFTLPKAPPSALSARDAAMRAEEVAFKA